MFDATHKLEISEKDLAVIEAALHTQSKILGVEAGAGGDAALGRLNDVKRALASITQQKPAESRPALIDTAQCRFSVSRIFG